jgi:hypothetical protein
VFETPHEDSSSLLAVRPLLNSALHVVLCTRGTIWYRLVGVNLAASNISADAVAMISTTAVYYNMKAEFTPPVQVSAPPNTSFTSGACR